MNRLAGQTGKQAGLWLAACAGSTEQQRQQGQQRHQRQQARQQTTQGLALTAPGRRAGQTSTWLAPLQGQRRGRAGGTLNQRELGSRLISSQPAGTGCSARRHVPPTRMTSCCICPTQPPSHPATQPRSHPDTQPPSHPSTAPTHCIHSAHSTHRGPRAHPLAAGSPGRAG